jgi:Tfp pilus assembly protein PilF
LYIALGNFYFSRNEKEKAETAYLKAIDTDPKDIKSYMVIAGFYDTVGRIDKTLTTYKKALDLQPDDIRIKNTIARFYLKNKKMEEAEKYILDILKERIIRPGF